MIKHFTFISPEAVAEIAAEISRLKYPGGMVGLFDAPTSSVIVLSVDKRSGATAITGWSIHGPCSENEAKELLRTEVGEVGKDGWARHLH